MNDQIRILATGELLTGELRLEFVPLDAFEFTACNFSLDGIVEQAVRLARAHGAVLFEIMIEEGRVTGMARTQGSEWVHFQRLPDDPV